MFINIVSKYGIVPLENFPESQHSANSKDMNWLITYKLREYAQTLREMKAYEHDSCYSF
jgi:bleomycin hydrolase